MRFITTFLLGILVAGCATHRSGTSRHDLFEDVKVDQMAGNNVSEAVLQKTVVCLNARRESKTITVITNISVTLTTNAVVTILTNQTVMVSTNYLVTGMTNFAPPVSLITVVGEATTSATEIPAVTDAGPSLAVTNVNPTVTTNVTVSIAKNQSAIVSPTQATANSQFVRTLNNQITTLSNNVSISLMTNQIVTMETNQVLNYLTNFTVIPLTNINVRPVRQVQHDYYLYTELLAPPDFTLQTGESLVLLVDGVRHGFSPGQSSAAFVGRKGFNSTLYRINPEVLVDIANAQEVKLRLKGINSLIERTMSERSRKRFRDYLLKYFAVDTGSGSSGWNSTSAMKEAGARLENTSDQSPASRFSDHRPQKPFTLDLYEKRRHCAWDTQRVASRLHLPQPRQGAATGRRKRQGNRDSLEQVGRGANPFSNASSPCHGCPDQLAYSVGETNKGNRRLFQPSGADLPAIQHHTKGSPSYPG
jgi:hypothetical protein